MVERLFLFRSDFFIKSLPHHLEVLSDSFLEQYGGIYTQ